MIVRSRPWLLRSLRTLGFGLAMAIHGLGLLSASAEDTTLPLDRVVAAYYPPLMIEDREVSPGIAIEVIRAAAERAGRKIGIEFMPFERAMHTLQQGSGILMPALFRNETREDQFRWIVEIHAAKLTFLTITQPIDTLDEARTLGQIAVEKGSSGDRLLTKLGFENLIRLTNPDSSARMLGAGRIDAWFLTRTLAEAVWKRVGIETDLISGAVISELPIYLVGGLDFPDAVAEDYRIAIEGMTEDGTISEILARYR